jgi:hypothetical protein
MRRRDGGSSIIDRWETKPLPYFLAQKLLVQFVGSIYLQNVSLNPRLK